MASWTPNPTFYPSAKTGMDAPREELGYVTILNPNGANRPDALGVLGLDSTSSSYGQRVRRDRPKWERRRDWRGHCDVDRRAA
jgi:selenium-binding protein 1